MLPIKASALKVAAEMFPEDHRLVLQSQSAARRNSFLVTDIDSDDPERSQATISNDHPGTSDKVTTESVDNIHALVDVVGAIRKVVEHALCDDKSVFSKSLSIRPLR